MAIPGGADWRGWLRSRWFLLGVLPLVAAVGAVKLLLLLLCFTYVGPGEYGIKVVRVALLGGERGVQRTVYEPGFRLVLRPFGLEEMYLLPRDVQSST